MRFFALIVASFFILAGCGGGGGGRVGLPSVATGGGNSGAGTTGSVPAGMARATFTVTIPSSAQAASTARRTSVISPSTRSIALSVNGGTVQTFNTTSSTCSTGQDGLSCTIVVGAPVGPDTFVVTTYAGLNGTGTPLNQGASTVDASLDSSNSVPIALKNVILITSAADSGPGSLRAAIAAANAGDYLLANLGGATITLASPLVIAQDITISGGPGTPASLTISGGGATRIFSVSSSAHPTIVGLTATNGRADTGGALDNSGTLNLYNIAFTSNTTGSGGGPSYYGGAIVNENSASLTIYRSIFTGNTVPQANGEGGAIYNGSATLYVLGSTFSANQAQYGGAIESDNDLTIASSTFTNNVASGSGYAVGGAVLMDNYDSTGLVVTNSTFTGNTAGSASTTHGNGGAIYDDSGAQYLTLNNVVFENNQATSSSDAYGGAVYVDGSSCTSILGTNVTFNSNKVTSPGGDYSGGGAVELSESGYGGGINFTNATFTGNSVSAGSSYGVGGAIDHESGGTLQLSGTTTFTSNSATGQNGGYGGAIEYYLDGECEGECSTVVRKAPASVHAKGATFHTAAAAAQRKAKSAGLKLSTLATRAKSGKARRTRTIARSPQTLPPSSYSIAGATFTSNSTSGTGEGEGGAIDFDDETESICLTITNTTFTTNTVATGNGGAIAVDDGTLTLSSSTLTGNTTLWEGGAIWHNGETVTISQSTISGNSVTGAGSGDGGGGIFTHGTMHINQSTISGNSVAGTGDSAGGGGIYNCCATLTASNSTISGNTSSGSGGGLYNDGSATFKNVTVYQNHAAGAGGSVENTDLFCFYNTILAGGSAGTGREINNDDTLQSNDYNLIQGTVNGSFSPSQHDILGVSPGLLALANNGGPTQTHGDQAFPISPGQGYIPYSSGCSGTGLTVDQRNSARGSNGTCDIGSYELQGAPAQPTPTPSPTGSP